VRPGVVVDEKPEQRFIIALAGVVVASTVVPVVAVVLPVVGAAEADGRISKATVVVVVVVEKLTFGAVAENDFGTR
jgi:hypothetical protein